MRHRASVVITAVAIVAATIGPAATARAATQTAPNAQSVVNAAIADLQSYWASEFPQVYGGPYKPVDRIIAVGPNTTVPSCQGQSTDKTIKGNAFYCFHDNFLAYDNQTLFPTLAKDFGSFAPALVLAHEWGHAIQDRAGIAPSQYPTIYVELQADCFAGTWARRVADGNSKHLKFAPGDLDTALAAYLSFRDPVGAAPDTAQSHGDAFDRVNAFQTGYEKGASACKTLLDSPPPITEQQFTNVQDAATGGNLPANQVIPVTMELLDEYYAQVAPKVPPLTVQSVKPFNGAGPTSQYPKCGGKTLAKADLQNHVLYCPADHTILYDQALFNSIYSKVGDFGFASLLGAVYASYVQDEQHVPGAQSHSENAALAADCETGAWAQTVQQGLPSPTLNNTTVTLAPGDLDKVIRAFIIYNATAGPSRERDFVFRRVEAFRRGFFGNFASCRSTYGNSSTSTPSS